MVRHRITQRLRHLITQVTVRHRILSPRSRYSVHKVSYGTDTLYQEYRYSARTIYTGEMVYSPLSGHGNRMRKPSCVK